MSPDNRHGKLFFLAIMMCCKGHSVCVCVLPHRSVSPYLNKGIYHEALHWLNCDILFSWLHVSSIFVPIYDALLQHIWAFPPGEVYFLERKVTVCGVESK